MQPHPFFYIYYNVFVSILDKIYTCHFNQSDQILVKNKQIYIKFSKITAIAEINKSLNKTLKKQNKMIYAKNVLNY